MQVAPPLLWLPVIVLGIAALSLWHTPRQNTPEQPRVSPPSPELITWIPYWDQASALDSLQRHSSEIDYISFFWFAVLADGSIAQYPYATVSPAIVQTARERGIQPFITIANLPTEDDPGDWDADRIDRAISTPQARAAHIADIIAIVRDQQAAGVNIDYEALRRDQRQDFTAFVRDLSRELHRDGKLLGVSLMPKTSAYDREFLNGSQAQDWSALARYADHLYLMTYEEHWEDSKPGSVASLPWMRRILTYAVQEIPPEKLFAGLGHYGYDWPPNGKARGLTYTDVQTLLETHSQTPLWDEETSSWRFTYDGPDGIHEVWYEDARSAVVKLDLIRQFGLTRVAFWRIGGEDQAVWELLQSSSR